MAVAGVTQLRVDSSVLDQLLRGCAEVRWEIQAVQDQDIAVETLDPQAAGSDPDLAVLRQILCDEAEVVIRPVGESFLTAPAAFWSVAGSLPDRRRLAQLIGASLYEPQILIHSTTGDLTGRKALTLAVKIGAVSPQRSVPLLDGTARLVGLQEVGVAR